MARYRILVTDHPSPTLDIERSILGDLPGQLVVAERGDEAELLRLAPRADAILSGRRPVTARVLEAASRCRIVTRYGADLANIAIEDATRLGIPVTYAPVYCVDEVAEHTLGLLFALERRLARFDRALRSGAYSGVALAGIRRMRGRALGLLGYGNMGRAVAERARGLGLTVLAYDPAVGGLDPEHGRAVTYEQLLAESDYLSLHVPLTPETQGIVNREAVQRMKPGAFLVNTARGALVELDAVLEGLEQGPLEGVALDVYPDEPPDLSHPLFRHERFLATPHAASYSEESVQVLRRMAATQVRMGLSGGVAEFIVNPDYREHSRQG